MNNNSISFEKLMNMIHNILMVLKNNNHIDRISKLIHYPIYYLISTLIFNRYH